MTDSYSVSMLKTLDIGYNKTVGPYDFWCLLPNSTVMTSSKARARFNGIVVGLNGYVYNVDVYTPGGTVISVVIIQCLAAQFGNRCTTVYCCAR